MARNRDVMLCLQMMFFAEEEGISRGMRCDKVRVEVREVL